MKLLHFIADGKTKLGVWTESGVLDVEAAAAEFGAAGGTVPRDAEEAIAGGEAALRTLRRLAEAAAASEAPERVLLPESGLAWAPCLARPNKIVCIGLNYRRHAEETNSPIPSSPIVFHKFNNALTAHQADVYLPRTSVKVDYEAELAIVIGRRIKDAAKERALDSVFGYCCANDLSARDLQMRTSQWALGKCCDGFAPLGPYLVTADEVGNPNDLRIRCEVNGEVRQDSNTSDMIFACDEIVSYLSQHMTLEPGDVILTGTPEGVVMGYPPERQVYLRDGDAVTVEIEKLGSLTNVMRSEAG
ncbi:fumarylacetoacetate hydrolase family protein [Cohnella zeiphila]|uniref:Fumarylacetoacetate hydrolase family protein n=1 Tax=Cohnella zeiphila TaxID=2761120 RepID=A0A7X0SIN6_9BACL|nr:fumarylacetoacetate hydrolase family protein [Cohnella zeiphila]MBB6730662.1 fumarylacetoacetate hydrolase family protein [Cohnella zeiphila]